MAMEARQSMQILKDVVRYAYAPVFFVGFVALAVAIVAIGANLLWLVALFLPAIALSFLAERIAPFEAVWNHSKGDVKRDILHATVNEISNALSVSLIPLLAALIHGFDIWPAGWPLWVQLLMAILVADFGITLAHFISHKYKPLWKLHAVHHSVERMYGFNGLMKHPLHQAVELIAGTTPLLLIGMPIEIGALLAFAAAIQLLLQHTNVDIRVGWLIFLWAVAPGHRHHHICSKSKGDVNFGLFTMFWDHLLGTFVIDRPQPRDGALGVAEHPDFPKRYVPQLIYPFKDW